MKKVNNTFKERKIGTEINVKNLLKVITYSINE